MNSLTLSIASSFIILRGMKLENKFSAWKTHKKRFDFNAACFGQTRQPIVHKELRVKYVAGHTSWYSAWRKFSTCKTKSRSSLKTKKKKKESRIKFAESLWDSLSFSCLKGIFRLSLDKHNSLLWTNAFVFNMLSADRVKQSVVLKSFRWRLSLVAGCTWTHHKNSPERHSCCWSSASASWTWLGGVSGAVKSRKCGSGERF